MTAPTTKRTSELRAQLGAVMAHPLTSAHLVVASASMLLGLGVLMVLSSSSVFAAGVYDDPYYFIKRQIVFMVAGIFAAISLARMNPSVLRVLAWVVLFLAVTMLVLTYTPLGVEVNGNRNWLQVGTDLIRIQPSEFAKLALIMWSADVFARKQALLEQPKHLLIPFLPVAGIVLALVMLQGDLGTAVIIMAIVAVILWAVGTPIWLLASMTIIAVGVLIPATLLSPHRMSRFNAYLNPSDDLDTANHQVEMGMYGIASGGWWGLGLGNSRQKWGALPEAHNDFIFAVVAEELGLIGSVAVLVLFAVLTFAGLRIAIRGDILFCKLTATGITAWFSIQALVNLGMVLRLVPVIGVPLPMVSYGGSALLANMCALGVLVACARHEPQARAFRAQRRRGEIPRVTTLVGQR